MSTGYLVVFTLLIGMLGGFLLGAFVFLGNGRSRTTADVRAAIRQDRATGARRHCTGVTARWCPLHGECTCRVDDEDEDDTYEVTFDNPSCPLHGRQSLHAAGT